MKLCYIDFEYNQTNEMRLNLVSCCLQIGEDVQSFWLLDPNQKQFLKNFLKKMRDEIIIVCFNATAEAHAILSLGLDELKFKYIDLQAEWRMLKNQNNTYNYGKILVNGEIKQTYEPNLGSNSKLDNTKAKDNLGACVWGMLKKQIDTDRKDKVRDIIIKGKYLEKYKDEILEYGESDTKILKPLWEKFKEVYKGLKVFDTNEILYRGESVARTSRMMAIGYPVEIKKLRKLYSNVPTILKEVEDEIQSLFPDRVYFKLDPKTNKNVKKVGAIREWIEKDSGLKDKWDKTEKGELSTALDAFERFYSFRHNYPKDNFAAQYIRYCRLRQSFSGFIPKSISAKDNETFFDYIGSDGRCRAWLNPYGAQTSRYQPKSKGFLFLKAAWMRSLCHPKGDNFIVGIDYSSQEFLISALLSNDKNMIEAYRSGDVYLYFAKLAGAVPWDGKKKDYKEVRDLFKSTTLGLSYGMGKQSLARKLSADTGKEVSVKEAQDLINKFYEAYPDYKKFRANITREYGAYRRLKLVDGWYMFGNNKNERSVTNFPIQGMGGCILRRAVKLCQEAGLKVLFPLHDAIYCESNKLSDIDIFYEKMKEAFVYCIDHKDADLIRLDINAWGDNLEGNKTPNGLKFKAQKIYVDERSESEYQKFKKYFQ